RKHFRTGDFFSLLQACAQKALSNVVEAAAQVFRQVHGYPLAPQLATTELFLAGGQRIYEFRNRIRPLNVVRFHLTTIDGFAVVLVEPLDECITSARQTVVTLARAESAAFNLFNHRLVLFE